MIGNTNIGGKNRTISANWTATDVSYHGHSGNQWDDYAYESQSLIGKDLSIITVGDSGAIFNVDGVMTATTFYSSDATSSNFAVGIGYTIHGVNHMIQGILTPQIVGFQSTCTYSSHVNAGDSIRWRIYGSVGRPNTYHQMCGATLLFISDY